MYAKYAKFGVLEELAQFAEGLARSVRAVAAGRRAADLWA
jgi:hypothetical protein